MSFFLVSPDERDRAAASHFQKDREHFIVARGALRSILGRYLHGDPAQLRFTYNEYGKPDVMGTAEDRRLRFNLSHTDGLALYAFNLDRQIGLDIEYVKDDFGCEEIAEQFFSIREIAMLRALCRSPSPYFVPHGWRLINVRSGIHRGARLRFFSVRF
jgi:4'-phosphopantetheinyl transferase